MDASKVEHYRSLLKARAQALQDSITAGLREAQADREREVGDAGDESVRLHDRDLSTHIGEADAARLLEIEQAQVRLTEGTYGICEDCGEPIDPERLELVPEARRCAPCQEAHEEAVARPEQGLL
jgi:RNA polymerase-binding protein DksA